MSQDHVPLSHGTPVQILDMDRARIVLDQDLAEFFSVETRVLNQAAKRNIERFPKGWAFQLSKAQFADLKSQSVISKTSWGGRRTPPWAFTEHGVVMAATILNSPRAIEASQFIVEAFVDHYNHQRYHESLNNVTPSDVYFGRAQAILNKRERIKRKTLESRRLQYRKHAA